MRELNNILVLKWGALGDLIAGTVALRALRRTFPRAKITMLTTPLMFEVCPPGTLADDIILYEPGSRSIYDHVVLVATLRRRKYDAVFNLRWSSERSALITLLCGALRRIGSGPRGWQWVYTIKAPSTEGRRHEFLRHLDIVRAAGMSVDEPEPFVYFSTEDTEFARYFLNDNELATSGFVIMHPGASTLSKAWPAERFAEIGRRFICRFHQRVVVSWGRDEESLARQVVSDVGPEAALAPGTTIGQLSALMSLSGLCVCNYSGVMNIGMAVRTPLVAIGCTSVEDWGPYGQLHRTVNSSGGKDSYSERDRFSMMNAISVEAVWKVVEQRWRELHPEQDVITA